MTNPLLLQSNRDIPYVSARCSIHNPSINEIAMIGEEDFQIGIRFLNFDKNDLDIKDKIDLLDKSDFEILIEIMNSKEYNNFIQKSLLVLTLLFPSFDIEIKRDRIELVQKENNFVTQIDKDNFYEFKEIIKTIFVLESREEGKGYNPANGLAAKIAEKLKKGRQKADKEKGEDFKNKTVYGKIVSILSVGLKKDKNVLMNYTVYQLLDEHKRFQLSIANDMNIKMRLAGATDLDEPEDWLGDLLL